MMKKLKNSEVLRIVIAISLPAVMIVLLTVIGIDTKNIAKQVVGTRTGISTRIRQSQNIARLEREASEADEKLVILKETLPSKDELFIFPNDIAEIGSQASVETSFSFAGEGEKEIGYNIIATGGYSQILDFLNIIEDDIPFMNVSAFSLISAESGFSINLRGSIFFNG